LRKEFEKRKIQSKIIVPRRNRIEDYGSDVIILGTSFPINFSGSQADFCINFNPLSIKKILNKEKFDILHFHNFGLPSAWQILEKSKALNILTFHANLEGTSLLKVFPEILYPFKKIIQWKIDGVIGVAPLTLKYFKDFKGPKTVISNGIDVGEFNPETPKIKKFLDNKINILFLGRIEERKGLIYLLRAFKILEKKFSNLRLIIIGEGELRKDCENWARENNLKEVYFEGEKRGQKVPPYYTTSDIFVSPAIFGESFGLVLLEAMASRIPVVAFANKGYKEFLKGKKGAFLVPPKDYKGLAKKIEVLIKNENLRKKMGEWGCSEAQNYSWDKISSQVLDFYQICQKNKEKRPKKSLSIEKIFERVANKDISGWLR